MEQQRKAYNLITIFLLTIVSIHHASPSSQNLYTTTIDLGSTDSDKITDHAWLQPLNATTSIYQDSTTYLPTTSTQTEEIFNSSETIAFNRYARPSYQHDEYTGEDDNSEELPDHGIPYSEHEEARDVPTKPKYVAPGVWAKPPPDKNIPLDFVPTKLHAQVRGSHTVKRLPQQEAIDSAETEEERRNAHRLKAVVTNSKVNTVYTEEGYEDSAYDHAGHIRDADFHEGFARKLRDQKKSEQDSSSDRKKKGKSENLSDEFKEYEEDYHDHLQENRKFEEEDDEDNLIGYGRNSWEGSEIDPKFVAENNIRKLEEDIEEETEETERNSKIYQKAQESKLRNNIKADSSELENEDHHVEGNLKNTNNSIKTKKKKSKLRNEKNGNVSKKAKQSRKLERKKELYPENYESTVLPLEKASSTDETLASPHGFVKNSPNSQIYSIDQTTLRYVPPITKASWLGQVDEPTTTSYSQLFWDYFKAVQGPSTTESSTLVPNSTTMNPQQEARTPIAVATIDGHGPYLLVTKEETVTSPPTFLDPYSFRSRNLFSDDVEFGPTSAQTHSRHLLGQNDDNAGYVNNVITTSTVATFTSAQPSPSLSPEDVEYSSSATLDTTVSSSTPAVMTINFTQEAYARIADYHENPFLGPVLDNSNIAVSRDKLKYKVVARTKPSHEKKPVKSITQSPPQQVSPSSFKKENEYKNIRNELSAKYNKMLNYIKNKQESQSFPKEKKVAFPEDFIPRRPPVQQAAYSIFLTDHPSMANRSSVPAESESSRESNWRNLLQSQHRSQSAKSPFRFDPVDHVQPVRPAYRKNSLPSTILLPPPPLASTYANYHNNKQNNNHHSYFNNKLQQQQQQRDNALKYFPLNPEASWKTRFRRKRSDEGEFRDGGSDGVNVDVKAAANNGVTNDDKSEQQDKSLFDRVIDRSEGKSSSRRAIDASINAPDAMELAFSARSGENKSVTSSNKNSTIAQPMLLQSARQNGRMNDTEAVEMAKKKRDVRSKTYSIRNLKNKVSEKNHEGLLHDSPKISGDVIDKEIAARFNEKDSETSVKVKKKGKIEIEVPSLDYIEKLAEEDLVKPSTTTTEAPINLKKYPFYKREDVSSASALKYIVDPKIIPRKTSRGMEFYDSRNAYKQCDEVEPNLDKVLPEKEEPDPERGPPEDLPRLRGLGDKLSCFKAKYFDENPLDNPLFAEKLVEEPTPPIEINPTKFASKIMILPEENDEYVVPQVSKKPERGSRQWRNRIRPYETLESIRINYKHDPQTGRGRNAYFHTVRGMRPPSMISRVKNRKSRPKSTTTTSSPKLYQTASYQNQVYEDVMGNIRSMKNSYQVYEMTTMPPSTQILAAAGSENMLKVADDTSSEEKSTSKPDVPDVTNNTKSSEIKGLIPPPKYLIHRQNYRKHRPLAKSRISLIRSTTIPRIIAHHHSIKLKKRSTTDDTAKNSSENTISENEKAAINESIEVAAVGNDTFLKLIERATNEINATSEPLDLEIEESRPISVQDRSLNSATLKIDDKKKRRNSTSSDLRSEPRRPVYTIRDRIRHSKPKWDARGFGKFTTSSKTAVDENSRRKEPLYNRLDRNKKPVDMRQNNTTIINSTENTSGIESATSLIEDRESSTTEVYHAEESAVRQTVYRKKNGEPEKAENTDTGSEESFEEDEEESTTNAYQVRENIDENASTTITRPTSPHNSKEVSDLREYLESDPPGYAETFPEEATTPSSKYRANMNHESDDSEEKQEEEEKANYPRNGANSWDNDSSEKIEEQVETPTKTELLAQDDDSRELSSREEEGSNKDQTFFTYTRRPLAESDKNDEGSEKATFYKPFPFSKYKSMFKKESEDEKDDSEEEGEKKSKDYVFPWHADKEKKNGNLNKWLHKLNRYEYPWERRDREAKERRRKRRPARGRIFDDEDEEESIRHERPIYPWERYNVPSNNHRNARRGISRRYIDDSEESTTVPFTKYSSRYSSSSGAKPKPSSAREISRSIKKFLEEDDEPQGKDSRETENRSPSFARKLSSPTDRGISRGTLVPEDITQPPRRRKARRKISQTDKNASNNSRFDSKKLRSEDITNEEKEDEPAEYRKFSLDEWTESPTETTSDQPRQLSNGAKEVPSATEPRKKRRRRILKNNSTISLDNALAGSITEPTKKRRKRPEVSTTTSATPSVETSTPKTRSIEHRSRVSKEKIITKTTYPDKTENFDSTKTNLTAARREPVRLRTKLRRRENINKRDDTNEGSNNKRELIKQEDKKEDYKIYAVSNLMQNIPLNRERGRVKKRTGSESTRITENWKDLNNGKETNDDDKGDAKQKRKPLLQAKFIKDPERRLYYYVERK